MIASIFILKYIFNFNIKTKGDCLISILDTCASPIHFALCKHT